MLTGEAKRIVQWPLKNRLNFRRNSWMPGIDLFGLRMDFGERP
jgi:hypothetical protein